MTVDRKHENKELSKLININEDAAEFYESALEKAEHPQIKANFAHLESLHKGVIINLSDIVRSNDGTPDADETIEGGMRQFFGELHAKVSNKVDKTLVDHLEEAEDRCLHSMQEAMKSDDVSPSTKLRLQKELSSLQKSHDYMRSLKDYMQEAA